MMIIIIIITVILRYVRVFRVYAKLVNVDVIHSCCSLTCDHLFLWRMRFLFFRCTYILVCPGMVHTSRPPYGAGVLTGGGMTIGPFTTDLHKEQHLKHCRQRHSLLSPSSSS